MTNMYSASDTGTRVPEHNSAGPADWPVCFFVARRVRIAAQALMESLLHECVFSIVARAVSLCAETGEVLK